jgi:hypothetical protein
MWGYLTLFLAVLAWAIWFVVSIRIGNTYYFDRRQAMAIVSLIQAGKLHPDRFGSISLPPNFVAQGWDNEAFVGHRSGLEVFFLTHRSRADWAGYLYTQLPLRATRVNGSLWIPAYGGDTLQVPPSHPEGDHWWYCIHPGHG